MLIFDDEIGLGSHWWIEVRQNINDPVAVRKRFFKEMNRFEQAYSRFKYDSILSELNRERLLSHPSPELIELLETCVLFNQKTEGYFNPFVGSLLESRGYDLDYTFVDSQNVSEINDYTGNIEITSEAIKLHGTQNLDFGGFGKGYLIQKFADILRNEFGFCEFLVNGGGDMYVASLQPQQVLLENPLKLGYSFGSIELHNQALACSSNVRRSWLSTSKKGKFGHIVNPKNIDEYIDLASFVVVDKPLIADIMATMCCIVGGQTKVLSTLKKRFNFSYALMDASENIRMSTDFPTIK